MKSQATRALDVLALGPGLVYAGVRGTDLPEALRALLIVSGAGTVVYNAHHFAALDRIGAVVELDPYAQAVRAFDVLALGPGMLQASTSAELGPLTRFALGLGGALTIVNNARNLLEVRR